MILMRTILRLLAVVLYRPGFLNANTGILSGSPTNAELGIIMATVTDSFLASTDQNLTISVIEDTTLNIE